MEKLAHRAWRWLVGEYGYWRVKKPVTRVFGPQHSRSRTLIEIDITYACNLRCFNCNRSCEQAPTGESMSVDQVERFVSECAASQVRWTRIRLLGGEPTLHKDFFEILSVLRVYRGRWSPETVIEVVTNGHGPKVEAAIARIPPDVEVRNTAKTTGVQPDFQSFNLAPIDTPGYSNADYRSGCWVTRDCGMGLGPSGYYPCAVAGGMDRILGWDLGRQRLPPATDSMTDLLERFCSHCGHFKRRVEPELQGPAMSPAWRDAYARYRSQRPRLTRYASDPDRTGDR